MFASENLWLTVVTQFETKVGFQRLRTMWRNVIDWNFISQRHLLQ